MHGLVLGVWKLGAQIVVFHPESFVFEQIHMLLVLHGSFQRTTLNFAHLVLLTTFDVIWVCCILKALQLHGLKTWYGYNLSTTISKGQFNKGCFILNRYAKTLITRGVFYIVP